MKSCKTCIYGELKKVGEDTGGDVLWCDRCGSIIDSSGVIETPSAASLALLI
jgi:hypothetical protein